MVDLPRFSDSKKGTDKGRKRSLGRATVGGFLPESETVFELEVQVVDAWMHRCLLRVPI